MNAKPQAYGKPTMKHLCSISKSAPAQAAGGVNPVALKLENWREFWETTYESSPFYQVKWP